MADFSTNIDIVCAESGEEMSAVITGNSAGATGSFVAGSTPPFGCVLTGESIRFLIDGESLGPYTSLPASLTLTGGETFSLSGTITNFQIVPDNGFVGSLVVFAYYTATGDTCGEKTAVDSASLSWSTPTASIDSPTDNGSGNFVFTGASSTTGSCPGGITGYTWTVYASNGITILTPGIDYTLNSADLFQSTLDATFSDGDYIIGMEITTDCGTSSDFQALSYEDNTPPPSSGIGFMAIGSTFIIG